MSQENIETVRAFVEAVGRDPKHGQSYLAADLEFIPFGHLDGPAQGPGGFTRRVEELSAQFETYEVRAERLEQVGELVIADLRREARTRRGTAVIKDRFSQVFTLQDGKIVRIDSFPSFAEALAAAGLRE
jgi:ketosteroid isomerase-like protein